MQFGFSDVWEVLANFHRIADDKRSAFSNRLKHLQKLGFPEGINTGRGRAAGYRPEHILQLSLVLELNQFGVGPDRAISIMKASKRNVALGVMQAVCDIETKAFICNIEAQALADLMEDPDGDIPAYGKIYVLPQDRYGYQDNIADLPFRIGHFSLTAIIRFLVRNFDESRIGGEFLHDLMAWAKTAKDGPDGDT